MVQVTGQTIVGRAEQHERQIKLLDVRIEHAVGLLIIEAGAAPARGGTVLNYLNHNGVRKALAHRHLRHPRHLHQGIV